MALESSKYDVIYGKLLNLGLNIDHAKELAKFLYSISEELDISIDQTLKYVTNNGIKFDNAIYNSLNKLRTSSSQIGFVDQKFLPASIVNQLPPVNNLSTTPIYQITVSPTSPVWQIDQLIRQITIVPSAATWTVETSH